ncbi:MAG: hypothetical protein D6725_12315 [Planctomycetota bacterium]|nr:MAG: hypothetical protein D6725_12315 [Planctomycetota bacterium]
MNWDEVFPPSLDRQTSDGEGVFVKVYRATRYVHFDRLPRGRFENLQRRRFYHWLVFEGSDELPLRWVRRCVATENGPTPVDGSDAYACGARRRVRLWTA